MGKIVVPGKEIVVPRIAVRPLLPPPPQFGARVQPQHLHWQVGRYRERLTSGPGGLGRGKVWVVEKEAEQHNLILDQTYDSLIASFSFENLARYAAVGTGSTPPSATQTGLVSEVARTGSSSRLGAARVSDHVYDYSVTREFTEAQVGGRNLTEWGFSPDSAAGNNLMCRELFRDGSGNPVVITLDTDQRLRLIYKYRVSFFPNTPQSVSINISGIGVRTAGFVLSRGDPSWWSILHLMNRFARGEAYNYTTSAGVLFRVLTSRIPLDPASTAWDNQSIRFALSFQAYTTGSRQRKSSPLMLGSGDANVTWVGFSLGWYEEPNSLRNQHIARFVLDMGQEFTKSDLYKLRIDEWTLTWGP